MVLEAPVYLQAVTGDPPIPYTAQQRRGMLDALAPLDGIVRKDHLAVTQRAAGANFTVDVAAGQFAVTGTSIAFQGTYLARSTAVENVPIAAAPASGSRTDLIVARVLDKQADGGTEYALRLLAVTGTVGGGVPAKPPSSIVLAEVAVAAGQASITNANITDRRQFSGLGDIPAWDYSGTTATPQSIPHNANTLYAPVAFNERVGVGTTANPGEVVCRTPGRYAVSFSTRFAGTGTTTVTERNAGIILRSAGGTLLRGMSTATFTGGVAPITVAGTFRMRAGEVLSPSLFQNSGAALSLSDAHKELDFTGAWVGP